MIIDVNTPIKKTVKRKRSRKKKIQPKRRKLNDEYESNDYVCYWCNVPGHHINQCQQRLAKEPPIASNYVCYKCQIPGHYIENCPNI